MSLERSLNMGKKRSRSSRKFRENHPREKNHFYRISDTNGGHPSRVYVSNPDNDSYYVQKFTSKKRRGRVKLLHNIDPSKDVGNTEEEQWLIKQPIEVNYDDLYYESRYESFRVHEDDMPTLKKYQINVKKKKR